MDSDQTSSDFKISLTVSLLNKELQYFAGFVP